ncbi:hypothetical protein TPE_1521 [Treponema pedis str. T A4]|uniref:Uncharacterized protein n=1 Tax=Treponema pedis str. T A4 TaxID=1291379 RepID=S6A415_9SPIR|nr:hypothetical protein TPE_1521 [Treponema pedis str. T A4]
MKKDNSLDGKFSKRFSKQPLLQKARTAAERLSDIFEE